MLRLAYLISRYPAVSHTFILREVRELRRLGVDVHAVSVNPSDRPESELGDEERLEAAKTFVLKEQRAGAVLKAAARTLVSRPMGLASGLALAMRLGGGAPGKTLQRLFYLAEAVLVGDWMRRRSLDHLHVHFATPAATVALLVKAVFGARFSMTVHGPDEFYDVREYHLAEKIDSASFICAIGSYCRSQLMKLSDPRHWSKLEVVPLGVDEARFRRQAARTAPEEFNILCLGRLVPAKGQAVLLGAVDKLRKQGRRLRVVFAGDGPDRGRLEAQAVTAGIADSCAFLGAVNPDRVRELYETADLFVLPSFAEGIPVALMEAMAMEVPCISTMVNGIPELIESGRQGILVPPSDCEALSSAIARLMDDPAYRRALARAGRDKVAAAYSLSRNVARLESIFRRRLEVAA
jgi:colanic acid/amylovoran biosynthesis glycosyltransferase